MKEKGPGKQNIAVSALLNIIRKACMVAFPLVTYSYATRVLGPNGIGIHEFSQSVVSYFAMVAALGIMQYAVRDGGQLLKEHYKSRELEAQRSELDDFASEVFSINVCMTVIAYVLMGVSIALFPLLRGYGVSIWIASSVILFTTVGVDWINSLFEDYLYLTIRYIIVSIVALVMLFVMVRSPEDVYKYIFIANFATIANGIMNFIYIRKYVRLRFTFNLNLAKHALPIFTLFCNNVSAVIYLNSDVTILGILTDNKTVGLYGMPAKIYLMIKELVNAAIFVTIPRFSMYIADGKESTNEKYYDGLKKLAGPLFTVLIPMCVGLNLMSRHVIFMVAGKDFMEGGSALDILAIAMFFAVGACFLAYAIVLPNKLEKYFLAASASAALVNIVLNFVMIPKMGFIAAAITTLIAEILVFTILLLVAAKVVKMSEVLTIRDIASTVIGSIYIAAVCIVANICSCKIYGISADIASGLLHSFAKIDTLQSIVITVVTVIVAIAGYAVILVVMKNSSVSMIMNTIRKKS